MKSKFNFLTIEKSVLAINSFKKIYCLIYNKPPHGSLSFKVIKTRVYFREQSPKFSQRNQSWRIPPTRKLVKVNLRFMALLQTVTSSLVTTLVAGSSSLGSTVEDNVNDPFNPHPNCSKRNNMNNTRYDSDDDSSFYEDSGCSQESEETREKRKHYLTVNEGDYRFNLTENSKRWILKSGWDVSDSFFAYRNRCISKCEDQGDLNKYEELALSGIMVIDDSICSEDYLEYEEVEGLLEEVDQVSCFKYLGASHEESVICNKLAREMAKRKVDYSFLDGVVGEWCHGDDQKASDMRRFQNMLLSLRDTYSMNYSAISTNEATLVRDTLDTILKRYFYNTPIMKCLGADNMIRSSSNRFTTIDPSLVNHGKRADFSIVSEKENYLLLTLEAKRFGRSTATDFIKLGKELKESLSVITKAGFENVGVVGLLQEGLKHEVYVMDHQYDGLYRMVLLRQVTLPGDMYSLCSLEDVVGCMKSIREVVHHAAMTVNRRVENKKNKNLPTNMMGFHSPITVDRVREVDLDPTHPRVKRAKNRLLYCATRKKMIYITSRGLSISILQL